MTESSQNKPVPSSLKVNWSFRLCSQVQRHRSAYSEGSSTTAAYAVNAVSGQVTQLPMGNSCGSFDCGHTEATDDELLTSGRHRSGSLHYRPRTSSVLECGNDEREEERIASAAPSDEPDSISSAAHDPDPDSVTISTVETTTTHHHSRHRGTRRIPVMSDGISYNLKPLPSETPSDSDQDEGLGKVHEQHPTTGAFSPISSEQIDHAELEVARANDQAIAQAHRDTLGWIVRAEENVVRAEVESDGLPPHTGLMQKIKACTALNEQMAAAADREHREMGNLKSQISLLERKVSPASRRLASSSLSAQSPQRAAAALADQLRKIQQLRQDENRQAKLKVEKLQLQLANAKQLAVKAQQEAMRPSTASSTTSSISLHTAAPFPVVDHASLYTLDD